MTTYGEHVDGAVRRSHCYDGTYEHRVYEVGEYIADCMLIALHPAILLSGLDAQKVRSLEAVPMLRDRMNSCCARDRGLV